MYGRIYVEYAYIHQGTFTGAPAGDRPNVDLFIAPGTYIGFRGEEKLPGGVTVWFQCESVADVRGQSQEGACFRNSALGMKGAFGNVFFGNWETAFKRTISPTNVGANHAGVWGTANLRSAGSVTLPNNAARANFMRTANNMIMYDSPNFGGFQVMAGYSALNPEAVTTGATNGKPRILSLGGQYSAGPIYVSAGYERHSDFIGASAGAPGNEDDNGWHFGAAYIWGPVRFGGQYTRQKFEHAGGLSSRVSAWHVGVDWRIAGPHGLRAAYTRAGDMKGSPGSPAVAGSQGQTRPGVPAAGLPNETGAHQWQIRYVYTFSKQTELTFGYVKLDNDGNPATGGATYNLFGVGGGAAPGNNQHAWAMAVRYLF